MKNNYSNENKRGYQPQKPNKINGNFGYQPSNGTKIKGGYQPNGNKHKPKNPPSGTNGEDA